MKAWTFRVQILCGHGCLVAHRNDSGTSGGGKRGGLEYTRSLSVFISYPLPLRPAQQTSACRAPGTWHYSASLALLDCSYE